MGYEQWAMSSGQRAMRDAGGNCVRRCRIGVRHESELNTVTGSFDSAQDDSSSSAAFRADHCILYIPYK